MKTLVLTLAIILCNSNFASAEQILLLADDRDALQARADLIQQAKTEIMVEYFAVTEDNTAVGAIALLCQAAQRGVKVRVIMDALSNSVKKSTIAAAYKDCRGSNGDLNLEFRLFNPANILKPSTFFYRNHGKMLNIDGEVMITGGRNVDGKYFGLDKKRNFIDLDIMISGKAVVEAKNYYNKLWNKSDSIKSADLGKFNPTELNAGCTGAEQYAECMSSLKKDLNELETASKRFKALMTTMENEKGTVKLNTGKNWLANAKEVESARFISNSPDANVGKNNKTVSEELYKIASSAQHDVLILSPYLIPTARTAELFKELIDRGVKITIITNSLKSTDNLLAQSGYREAKKKIIAMGIELYEFDLVDTAHAKSAVIDGKVSFIGTYNLDPRSDKLNREIGIIVEDTNVGEELTTIINSFKDRSLLVGKDGQEQNLDLQNKDVSKFKINLTRVLEMALPLFRNQL